MTTREDLRSALSDGNVQAFLKVVRTGEGTAGSGGYSTLYGGGHFDSFSDHPRKRIKSGKWTSSAAGAYQILEKTWDELVTKYGFSDFIPPTQDEAACALLIRRDALQDVIAGNFDSALKKCGLEWASLPGSPYGQPTISKQYALAVFVNAGGVVATTSGGSEMVPIIPIAAKFALAALPELLNVAPKLISIFGDSPQADKNAQAAEALVQVAKQVTDSQTTEEAVQKIKEDPEQAQAFQQAAYAQYVELSNMTEKSIGEARKFNQGEEPLWGKVKFIHILSVMFVVFCGVGGILILTGTFTAELKGAVATLMLIGGWNGVKEYWFGSSYGSHAKDERVRRED